MAQKNEHLTTEQLSAFLDGKVSAEERTQWGSHLKTCQQCQEALMGLQQTVALLHALPQPALPRSFMLPADTVRAVVVPALAATRGAPFLLGSATRQRPPYLRVAFRTLSALAAVIGIVFLASGILPTFAHGGGATATSSAAMSTSKPSTQIPSARSNSNGTSTGMTPAINGTSTPVAAAKTHDTLVPEQPENSTAVSTTWPTILIFNLSTPEGRLGFGIILFILGVMGYVLFRRQHQRAP